MYAHNSPCSKVSDMRHSAVCICRLEPVIIELERQRSPVVVIAHQERNSVVCSLIMYSRRSLSFLVTVTHQSEHMHVQTCVGWRNCFCLFQAILRALYAYFADKPLKEVPHIEVSVIVHVRRSIIVLSCLLFNKTIEFQENISKSISPRQDSMVRPHALF